MRLRLGEGKYKISLGHLLLESKEIQKYRKVVKMKQETD